MKNLFVCLLLAIALWADVDLTGKWSGTFEPGDGQSGTALLMLTQTGTEITGSVGPDEDQRFSIQKGKIEGDKVTLEVENEGHKMHFALVLAGDHLKGEAHMEAEGQTRTAKIDVTRSK
ncbi:conserved exported hypothetical protein [Candidatus Sulfopaludibacter sp. SbA4]|nr:conserved exported hypothetical protein [Candidatus Sulfopaludibacter sp. SbA4]